jgi:hypothetical protein
MQISILCRPVAAAHRPKVEASGLFPLTPPSDAFQVFAVFRIEDRRHLNGDRRVVLNRENEEVAIKCGHLTPKEIHKGYRPANGTGE